MRSEKDYQEMAALICATCWDGPERPIPDAAVRLVARVLRDADAETERLRKVASAAAHYLAVLTLEGSRGVLVLDSSETAKRDLEKALAAANAAGQ